MALSDLALRNAKPRDNPYKLFDGGGLHLLVNPNGSRIWRLAYRFFTDSEAPIAVRSRRFHQSLSDGR